MGGTDYFTIEEFQNFSRDTKSPHRYEEADVDTAQAEVTEHLEKWAGSAWPTIAPPILGSLRENSERFNETASLILLGKRPIIEFTLVTLAGSEITLDNEFTADLDAGIIRFGSSLLLAPLIAEYTYGYDDTPSVIKVPVMMAVQSLLDTRRPGSKIPAGTSSYTSEGTTIILDDQGSNMAQPWPWDDRASDQVFGYWDAWRPKTILAVG